MHETGKYLVPGFTYKIVDILNKKNNLVNSLLVLYKLQGTDQLTEIKLGKVHRLLDLPFITTECMFYRFGKNGKCRCSSKQIVINGSNLSVQAIKKLIAQSTYTQEIVFLEPVTNVINLLTCNEYVFITHVVAWARMLKHLSFSVGASLWPAPNNKIENVISNLRIMGINENMSEQLHAWISAPFIRLKILNRLMCQRNFLVSLIRATSKLYVVKTDTKVKELLAFKKLPKIVCNEIKLLLNAKN